MYSLDSNVQLLSLGNSGWLVDEDAFVDMIWNLFNVKKRSLIFKRECFFDLEPYLFRLFGKISANLIQAEIKNALQGWIPGITIEQLTVEPVDQERKYVVTLALSHPVLEETKIFTTQYQSYA